MYTFATSRRRSVRSSSAYSVLLFRLASARAMDRHRNRLGVGVARSKVAAGGWMDGSSSIIGGRPAAAPASGEHTQVAAVVGLRPMNDRETRRTRTWPETDGDRPPASSPVSFSSSAGENYYGSQIHAALSFSIQKTLCKGMHAACCKPRTFPRTPPESSSFRLPPYQTTNTISRSEVRRQHAW